MKLTEIQNHCPYCHEIKGDDFKINHGQEWATTTTFSFSHSWVDMKDRTLHVVTSNSSEVGVCHAMVDISNCPRCGRLLDTDRTKNI